MHYFELGFDYTRTVYALPSQPSDRKANDRSRRLIFAPFTLSPRFPSSSLSRSRSSIPLSLLSLSLSRSRSRSRSGIPLSLLSLSRSTAFGKPFHRCCCCCCSQLLSSLKGSQRKTKPERIEAMKDGVLLLPLASLCSLQNSRLVDNKKKSSSSRSFFHCQIASVANKTPASFLLFPKSPSRACSSSSRSTPSKARTALRQGRVSGRGAAGVKSKPYEASKSAVLLEKGVKAGATIPWLEPKRERREIAEREKEGRARKFRRLRILLLSIGPLRECPHIFKSLLILHF